MNKGYQRFQGLWSKYNNFERDNKKEGPVSSTRRLFQADLSSCYELLIDLQPLGYLYSYAGLANWAQRREVPMKDVLVSSIHVFSNLIVI